MTIWFLDPDAGNDANDGLSFANRKKRFKALRQVVRPGDTVRVKQTAGSKTPSLLTGQNMQAYYTYDASANLNTVYQLSAANHLQLGVKTSAEGWTWVPSTGVTISETSTSQQRKVSFSFNSATFAGGKMAYAALPSSLDLSTYDTLIAQFGLDINFNQPMGNTWAQATTRLRLCLCTDTAGNTVNKEIDVTGMSGPDAVFAVANTGAMSSAIRSVAVYLDNPVTVSGGAIFTCHAIVVGKQSGILPGDLLYMNSQSAMPMLVHALYDTQIILVENYRAALSYRVLTTSLYRLRMNYINDNDPNNWLAYGTTLALDKTCRGVQTTFFECPSLSGERCGDWYDDYALVTISGGWDATAMTSQTGYSLLAFSGQASGSINVLYGNEYQAQKYDRFGFFVFGNAGLLATSVGNPAYIEATDCPFMPLGVAKWDAASWSFGPETKTLAGMPFVRAEFFESNTTFNALGIFNPDDLSTFWNIYAFGEFGLRSGTPFFATGTINFAEDIATNSPGVANTSDAMVHLASFNDSGWTASNPFITSDAHAIGVGSGNKPVMQSATDEMFVVQDGKVTANLAGYAAVAQDGTISVASNELVCAVPANKVIGWLYLDTVGDYILTVEFKCAAAAGVPIEAVWNSGKSRSPDYVPINTRSAVEMQIRMSAPGFVSIQTLDNAITIYSFELEQV